MLFCVFSMNAQILNPVKWSFKTEKAQKPNHFFLIAEAKIDKSWHLYAQKIEGDGPVPTSFSFEPLASYQKIGAVIEKGKLKVAFEDAFGIEVRYYENQVQFVQEVAILSNNTITIKGYLEYMVCDDKTCLPPTEVDFAYLIPASDLQEIGQNDPSKALPSSQSIEHDTTDFPPKNEIKAIDNDFQTTTETANLSFWSIMLLAFGFGLLAVITPCVFPMLPMTVSFFTKSAATRAQGTRNALIFGGSIVFIYTTVGLVFGLFGLGPDFGNWLSTHWVPNVLFFAIFIIFGASFLGLFEITLPSGLVNKVDAKSNVSTLGGIFFMGFTLVLVSFSCTGPIVGSLLIDAVGGNFIKPVLGMFAFSLGIALPFSIFAIFPGWLTNLPKSGGWLNSVKVTLGFLELALALKFLSIADQTYHWGILDREIYLVLWIVIFAMLGFYLLGKISLPHDSPLPYIGVPRLFLAIIVFSFTLYLVPGLWGAPLKALAGYLPPQTTLDFDLYNRTTSLGHNENLNDFPAKVKYADKLHFPPGFKGFFDMEEAKTFAKKVNKPIFIDFTGHGCVNCREMEARVWTDSRVRTMLQTEFVLLALYVDDKTVLPEEEWYQSKNDGKMKKEIGKQNADLQITRFNANAQPYYVIIDTNEQVLVKPHAYDLSIPNFISFLEAGLNSFRSK